VVPINIGVRLPSPDGKVLSTPEVKLAIEVVVNDARGLSFVAEAMAKDSSPPHECLFYAADAACNYFISFFNQFVLHPSEWSRFCLACTRNGDIHVTSKHILYFGCAPSIDIAKRFAHLVRQIVIERMIANDTPFVEDLRRHHGDPLREIHAFLQVQRARSLPCQSHWPPLPLLRRSLPLARDERRDEH
jgi:hypothetical protein